MSSLDEIASTIATEFTAAVRAESKARAQQADDVITAIGEALQQRSDDLAEVRRLQEEAARIAAESIKLAEKAEARFSDLMRAALRDLNAMRGAAPLPARAKVRAITGGKQEG
jgi:hypothetical protein